ncbi:Ctr copper transporter family-domain-containing protein [Rhypophila decipiens]|uniref:Copper transport protein n=1 Tax=Rhypophila decipiens TaxID=261697 RepID=A0AAN6XVZ7_9PEZI|nr:Ctr copper transporter family-domain-containing protein [Rhypophila decipiens]
MASPTLQSNIVLPSNPPPSFQTGTSPYLTIDRRYFDYLVRKAYEPKVIIESDSDILECNTMGNLLNFNVTDTCFLHEDWYIETEWMFALTCLAVAFLVFTLEALRMALRSYGERLVRKGGDEFSSETRTVGAVASGRQRAPSAMHQLVRALIYLAIVINAYVLILFAVSFNGYILLSIFLASYFAFFFFTPLHTTTRSAVTP